MSESFRPSPESAPATKDTGLDSSTEKSEKKDSKKKTKLKTRLLGGAAAEKVLEVPKETKDAEAPPKSESLWQKLVKEEADTESAATPEQGPAKDTSATQETKEASADAQLETLSTDEARETVRQYTDARLETITTNEQEQSADYRSSAEDAADAALLESIQQKLAEDPERPVEEALDAAEREVAETIQSQEDVATLDSELEQQAPPPKENFEDAAYDPRREQEQEEPQDTHPTSFVQPPPVVPPAERPEAAGGDIPPTGGTPVFTRTEVNAAATPIGGRIAEQQLRHAERTAAGRGLIVGGIVGYLIGKRRGRIKSEKQLIPVQEKLQKQVESLTTAVAAKEQRVRVLAAEKAAILQTQAEKDRFAESLRPAPSAEIVGKNAVRERVKQPGALHVERLGKIIVETPAVLAETAAAGVVAERSRDKSLPVDFSKKAEAYNSQELKAASEKIRIDGVTLKEIQQSHSLDERAVRRIMKQYLEGGNVREALNHEIVEKELKYERDPRLRAAQANGQGSASGTAAVAGAAMLSLLGAGKDNADGNADTTSAKTSEKKPVPDKATLTKLRKQQATELAAVSITIIIFFAVLIALVI